MRIYLAGPEVFLADAEALAAAKRAICAAHGLEGVFPLDAPPLSLDLAEPEWLRIYRTNAAHIRSCDALIANLTPFRGPSADAGTVYELGLMIGLGRPVCGYSNVAEPFGRRSLAYLGATARRRPDGAWEDAEGLALEDTDLPDNLMIPGGIFATGGRFETEAVPPPRRWHDLAAFERCAAYLASRASRPAG